MRRRRSSIRSSENSTWNGRIAVAISPVVVLMERRPRSRETPSSDPTPDCPAEQARDTGCPSPGPALLLCQGGTRFQCVEDDADELSLEAADRFAAALPFCLFALEVGGRRGVIARLRDRDPVER